MSSEQVLRALRGREWQPAGEPVPVRVYDFIDPQLGKAIPYGVHDVARNEGWVNVGIDHTPRSFAVESIRDGGDTWVGEPTRMQLVCSSRRMVGGSNGYRTRLWKLELQRFADKTGLDVTVAHYPPGTSKWNKIEHRFFCHITQNWRGRPLESVETIVSLIANTTTSAGLRVKATIDANSYEKAISVSDAELANVHIKPHRFHGDWNYTIGARSPLPS